MRKTGSVCRRTWIWYGAAVFAAALMMVLLCNGLMFTSQAAEGKVTASSVNIRKEASTSSEKVGSAANGETFTINSEVTGADNMVWYQVTKGNVTGYIRSDLMQKVDEGGQTGQTVNPSVEVVTVNPLEATVTNGEQVRVRADASSDSNIITTVSNGTKVTVKGQAAGGDGKTWYLVIFQSGSDLVEGFIREDYLQLSGTVVPETDTPSEGGDTPAPPSTTEPGQEQKLYDVRVDAEGVWYLDDYAKNQSWDLEVLLKEHTENAESLVKSRKSVSRQKIAIVVLVVLLIAAILLATMLYFKVKDVTDEAYFTAVERETIRERNAMRTKDPRAPTSSGRRMQTISTEGSRPNRSENGSGTRSAAGGVRPAAGTGRPGQVSGGTRPASGTPSQRPSQAGAQQHSQYRPSAGGTRPVAGQNRPMEGQPRPAAGASRPMEGQPRPAAGTSRPAEGQPRPAAGTSRPTEGQPRPAAQPRPAGQPAAAPGRVDQGTKRNDDDEFEFDFLNNWDGEN